jgi:hypothetical protein
MAFKLKDVSAENMTATYDKTVTVANGSEAASVQASAAFKVAADNGVVSINEDVSDEQLAAATLGAVKVTVDESTQYTATYSFGSTEASTTLDNKNIISDDALKETNTTSDPQNKFQSSTDPFYEEDAVPANFRDASAAQMKAVTGTDTTAVVAALYQQNLNAGASNTLAELSMATKQEEDAFNTTCGEG